MTDSLSLLLQQLPQFVAYGLGLGIIVFMVSWAIGKLWSLIHIAD